MSPAASSAAKKASRIGDAGRLRVSFEFFPPKTEEMEKGLWEAIGRLAPLSPSFVSVTYGAGGSTRERTHSTVKRMIAETALTPAAHLTCVAATRGEIDGVIQSYRDAGVRHIVALRGDPTGGIGERYAPHPDGYESSADLVAGIRRAGDIEVSVSAYPEKHPDSPSVEADIDMLKRKVDAGATRAITQFFFEADTFFRFRDDAAKAGIHAEIVPGIMPVMNYANVVRMSAMCGTAVPGWMERLFEGLDDHPASRQLVAATLAAELCRRLYAGGIRQFHFYTLNRAELAYAICHLLGVRPK
jgi:methylenetetrahydrofolate reductase (NADPH)